jgi:very-short-patch-repair endonuclease
MPVAKCYADFLCRERSLIIEIDGHSHDVDPGRDIWRDRLLTEAGFRVLHFSNADVLGNVEGVITVISLALGIQAHPQPLPQAGGE